MSVRLTGIFFAVSILIVQTMFSIFASQTNPLDGMDGNYPNLAFGLISFYLAISIGFGWEIRQLAIGQGANVKTFLYFTFTTISCLFIFNGVLVGESFIEFEVLDFVASPYMFWIIPTVGWASGSLFGLYMAGALFFWDSDPPNDEDEMEIDDDSNVTQIARPVRLRVHEGGKPDDKVAVS